MKFLIATILFSVPAFAEISPQVKPMPKAKLEKGKAEKEKAKAAGKTIMVWSQAYTESGAVNAPYDAGGKYLRPFLCDIIEMQQERLNRIAYAKEMELKELNELSTV